MSNDRPVATDALATLGTAPIPDDSGRDAIHLAVEPVLAGEWLAPGEHVVMRGKFAYGTAPGEGVGIADPFVQGRIEAGAKFWLVLYPRQITSLRHVWSHPAFPDEVAPAVSPDREASEAWMMAWAKKHMSEDYYGEGDRVSNEDAYAYAIRAGHENHVGPYEDARDHIDSEWWGHWEAITGERGDRDSYFSCSC